MNCEDEDSNTPLIHAGKNGDKVVVKLLLEKGPPDLERKNWHRMTALACADANEYQDVVSLLLEYGAKREQLQPPDLSVIQSYYSASYTNEDDENV